MMPPGKRLGRLRSNDCAQGTWRTGATRAAQSHWLWLSAYLASPASAPRLRDALLIGSTGKSIWGGLRIGWIRAAASRIGEPQDHPSAAPLSAPPMQQLVATELLGDLEPVLRKRRHDLRHQRDRLSNLPAGNGRWHFTLPSGGALPVAVSGHRPRRHCRGTSRLERGRTRGRPTLRGRRHPHPRHEPCGYAVGVRMCWMSAP